MKRFMCALENNDGVATCSLLNKTKIKIKATRDIFKVFVDGIQKATILSSEQNWDDFLVLSRLV